MNPAIIRKSIKEFIRAHEMDLVEDLEHGGTPKLIRQITTSRFGGVDQVISINIETPNYSSYYDARQFGNSGGISYAYIVTHDREIRYRIMLRVFDYAQKSAGEVVGGEYEAYDIDTETFDTFCARLAYLFREYTTIPPSSGSFTIEVAANEGNRAQDRRIDVRDESGFTKDPAGATVAALYKTIEFECRVCGEPTPL